MRIHRKQGQLFCPRQQKTTLCLCWGKNRFPCYDIHTEALPLSVNCDNDSQKKNAIEFAKFLREKCFQIEIYALGNPDGV